ncbi:hypothetical protein MRS44_003099 [Fusarium solani]|uniref:uncharacterized protein n=1 Tax=Fusarium solani TaxID=169388 RepID=UPI0032C3EEBA|nr:hypothetical protein MRS44_003099 [Fusarium solani]
MNQQDGPITSIAEPGIKANFEMRKELRSKVSALLERNSMSFPGAQPVSFARQHLDELTRQESTLPDRSQERLLVHPQPQSSLPLENDQSAFHTSTLVDGELVWDSLPSGKKEPRFLVFDCLAMDGNKLMDRTLDKRLAYFKERLYTPYKRLFQDFPDELQFQPFYVEMKPFQLAYGIEMMFKQVLPSLKHGNDGLIFTCRNTAYKNGTDPHILKWKPPEENTVDFRLRLTFPLVEPDEEERSEGITEPFVDYDSVPKSDLWVYLGDSGERYERFAPVYITEEEWEILKSLGDPLNNRVVECNLDDQGRWRIVRFRDDKSEANHTSTVKSVLESINDRVTEQDLYKAAGRIRDNWKARAARESR